MRFLHPAYGWWMLAALAALGVIRWRVRRTFVASTTVRWLAAPRYRASWLRRLPVAVLATAVLLLACALAGPVLPYSQTAITSRGLDIVIALDLSSSMLEELGGAGQPGTSAKTRLAATKDAIRSFVTSRLDDRIALVVFSDNAYVISPLTFDHEYVVRYVDLIDDQLLRGEGMTAIGDGLALSNYLLAGARQDSARGGGKPSGGADRRNQVVILFTDGENNRGRDPLEALKESNAANIRVHMVGVDLEEEVRNKPQVQRLFQSVGRYGGRYFNARTARDLQIASRTLDQTEKGVLVSRPFVRDAPVYDWFAVPALVCLVLALALRAVPFFIDYT